MHGMINKAVQCFVTDFYGENAWSRVADAAYLPRAGFEPMFSYNPDTTDRMLAAAVDVLAKPRATILEDLGTYLVTHPSMARVRRLLRFGGGTFVEFLSSLDELPDRVRLALPDLDFPSLQVFEESDTMFHVRVAHWKPGFGCVLVGILRAMSDDYGALALLDYHALGNDEVINVHLAETAFSDGRRFDLGLTA
ncbi:MAG: heme NO-binding domain-containing protein [Pseudomonadota bacterium]